MIELKGWKRWAFPLLVIGANSIAVYVMSWTMESFVSSALVRHLGTAPFLIFGPPFEPVLRGFGVLLVFWLILLLDVSAEDFPEDLIGIAVRGLAGSEFRAFPLSHFNELR